MRIGVVHTFASPCRCHATTMAALTALGHEAVEVDTEALPGRLHEIAALDLVFDHTDRFRGEGLLRPMIAQLLEQRGARAVGSSAAACFLTDDKVAAKARLAAAGVPVPRGATIAGAAEAAPLDLAYPRIL